MAYSYARALRFLAELEMHGIKLGLENVRVILANLGDPHRARPSILVGGTNGKGSVAATLDAILRRCGMKVGLYTSPHLIDCRERIRVGGKVISQSAFASAAEAVAEATAKAHDGHALARMPTYFEVFTAMAFEHFRREKVDLSLLEVGMGGRFDATNVVTPLCSIITNVSLDHTQYLGKTVREIAAEKAGIIKARVPALTFARERALSVLRGRARQLGAPLHEVATECRIDVKEAGLKNVFELRTPERNYGELELALRGRHQIDNAVIAIRALELLCRHGICPDEAAIKEGLRQVRWPGRLQTEEATTGRSRRPQILLDGAHNPDGARTLRAYLAGNSRPRSTVLLLGLTQGRDPREMARLLLPIAAEAILTHPPGKTAIDARRIAEEAPRHKVKSHVLPEWKEAFAFARGRALEKGALLVVTGSLYLVGAILGELHGATPAT